MLTDTEWPVSPLKGLNCVAYQRSVKNGAELFWCGQSHPLSGASRGQNYSYREIHRRAPEPVSAPLGVACEQTAGIQRPVGGRTALLLHFSSVLISSSLAATVFMERTC